MTDDVDTSSDGGGAWTADFSGTVDFDSDGYGDGSSVYLAPAGWNGVGLADLEARVATAEEPENADAALTAAAKALDKAGKRARMVIPACCGIASARMPSTISIAPNQVADSVIRPAAVVSDSLITPPPVFTRTRSSRQYVIV